MKKTFLALFAPLLCFVANAQWSAPDASNTIHNTNNGFVGISNSSPFTPSTLLHLYSTTTVAEQKIQTQSDGYAQFTLQSNQKAFQFSKRPSYENDALALWYFDGTSWQSSPYMTILPGGNIGIGTKTTNGYKLAVEGTLGARQVVVNQSTWSDFVFDKSYRLIPLDSVSAFLQQYRHLPDIPSADEVRKNGIDLGRNQALLLQKIEELTLYLIQAEAENKQLKTQLKSFEERLSKLEQKQ
ncbi:hypothetical protein [Puia dinghuensis]|uniref:BZIP transcription factor n=1 Tax=Puia dinghuensis TaxID=1792502 RepID=A0A8J2U6L3_9BACT|nr:hypothetical protein [Puia dinghuensis]GGA82678.1 hypothetical protein GCM10011511_02100 [Puia dinghuensis]